MTEVAIVDVVLPRWQFCLFFSVVCNLFNGPLSQNLKPWASMFLFCFFWSLILIFAWLAATSSLAHCIHRFIQNSLEHPKAAVSASQQAAASMEWTVAAQSMI